MSHESIQKQNTQEKIIIPESQEIKSPIDSDEILLQKNKKEIENLQKRNIELKRAEELRNELTKTEEVELGQTIKEEPKRSKIGSLIRKAALALGLTGSLIGKAEFKNVKDASDDIKIDSNHIVLNESEIKGESIVNWEEAQKISNSVKEELSLPITKESTDVKASRFDSLYNNENEENYYNPKVEKNISSGNMMQDLLYRNQWLYDVPVFKNIIKKIAKKIARQSEGYPVVYDSSNLSDSSDYTGFVAKNFNKDYVKESGGDMDLLGNYFDGGKLPLSNYRPSSDYLEFLPIYSIKKHFNKNYSDWDKDNLVRKAIALELNTEDDLLSPDKVDELRNFVNRRDEKKSDLDKRYDKFIAEKNTIYNRRRSSKLADDLGVKLARHTTGMAWDKDIDLPYVSISDAWDFEPNSYSKNWIKSEENNQDPFDKKTVVHTKEEARQIAKVQATLLHKAGEPYKIYDRFYFNPKSKRYLDDETILKLKEKKGITKESEVAQRVSDNTAEYFGFPEKKVFNDKEYVESVDRIIKGKI